VPQADLSRTDGADEVGNGEFEPVGVEAVEDAISRPALIHESGRFEDGKMPRNGRPSDREPVDNLARGQLARLEVLEDLTAGGIRQRPKDGGLTHLNPILAKLLNS
jgi:hypothetical protein